MPRVKVDYRSASIEAYKDFCKKNPNIKISYEEWKKIIYTFNESYRDYLLETGEEVPFPNRLGKFAIIKKKRKKIRFDPAYQKERINLPIDWKKTKEKGKYVYNFNFDTEGYFFGWRWFKTNTILKHADLWTFKPSRVSSRLITHYIRTDKSYQDKYKEIVSK